MPEESPTSLGVKTNDKIAINVYVNRTELAYYGYCEFTIRVPKRTCLSTICEDDYAYNTNHSGYVLLVRFHVIEVYQKGKLSRSGTTLKDVYVF